MPSNGRKKNKSRNQGNSGQTQVSVTTKLPVLPTNSSNQAQMSKGKRKQGKRGKGRRSKKNQSGESVKVLGRHQPLGVGSKESAVSYTLAGQHGVIDIQVPVNVVSLWYLANVWVNFALTLGFNYDKSKSTSTNNYVIAFQQIYLEFMTGNKMFFDKAPWVFWAITNAMQPKVKIRERSVMHSYKFSLPAFADLITASGRLNMSFGNLNPTLDPNVGLHQIFPAPVAGFFELNLAISYVKEVFNYISEKCPSIPRHGSYLDDASIYSWYSPWLTNPPQSTQQTDYAASNLESPITTPWLAKCALGGPRYVPYQGHANIRLPKFTIWGYGNAATHVGIRLSNGQMCQRRFDDYRIIFKIHDSFVTINQLFAQLFDANTSRRTANQVSGPTFSPLLNEMDFWNLVMAAIHFINGSYAPSMHLWGNAVVGGFCPLPSGVVANWPKVGENLVFGSLIAENLKSVKPFFNILNNSIIVPIPTINSGFAEMIYAAWGNARGFPTTTAYGGIAMDYTQYLVGTNNYNITAGSQPEFTNALVTQGVVENGPAISGGTPRDPQSIDFLQSNMTRLVEPNNNADDAALMTGQISSFFTRYGLTTAQALNVAAVWLGPVNSAVPGDTVFRHSEGETGGNMPLNQSLNFNMACNLPNQPFQSLDINDPDAGWAYDDPNIFRMLTETNWVKQDTDEISTTQPVVTSILSQVGNFVNSVTTNKNTEFNQIIQNRNEAGEGGALASIAPGNQFFGFLDTIAGIIPGVNTVNNALDIPAKVVRGVIDTVGQQRTSGRSTRYR